MSTTTSPSPAPAAAGGPAGGAGPARAFLAVLWRDLYVTGRELPVFLAQVVLQPLFLLFVFGKVLTDLGFAQPGYTRILFPGILALTAFVTGLQSTAFPLVIDFSFTKEIEDRLLAPLPVGMVWRQRRWPRQPGPAGGAGDAAHRRLDPGLDPVAAQRPAPVRDRAAARLPGRLVPGHDHGHGRAPQPHQRHVRLGPGLLLPLLFTGASQHPLGSPWTTCPGSRW